MGGWILPPTIGGWPVGEDGKLDGGGGGVTSFSWQRQSTHVTQTTLSGQSYREF